MNYSKLLCSAIMFLVLIAWSSVFAGTLSCSVATTCPSGTVIYRMSGTSNAHAELPTQALYTQLVCCTGVTGLGTACTGTFATALKLSGTTNAHVQQTGSYANSACISVPTGGTVSIGYQATNCTGFDTTLGSMSGVTNAHVGDGAAYTTKICGTAAAAAGTLTVDIVDATGSPVPSPTMAMGAVTFSFTYQTTNGTFGVSTQKVRVNNTTTNPQWTLTIAANAGPTAFWDGVASDYDFNDPTAGAVDGSDADSLGGQMTINPSGATITPQSGCTNTGLTLGTSASYSEGVTNTITLLTAGASAGTSCYWDTTGIAISQTIPREQPAASDYDINMTLTVTAI